MGASYSLGAIIPKLTAAAFALSGSAPGTAAAVGLCCALLATYY